MLSGCFGLLSECCSLLSGRHRTVSVLVIHPFTDSRCFYLFLKLIRMERHEEDLNCILGSRGTAENLCSRLTSYMKQKRVELNQTRNRLQKIRQTLSSKQTRHKISRSV